MTVALSSLRVTADMDSSGYARGAEAVASANARMAASGQLAGAAMAQQDAAAGRTGGTLVSLSKQYIDGYSSVARFGQQVSQLQSQMEMGNVSAARAATTYSGLVAKFNLYANATQIAAAGNRDFANVIDQVNAKAALQIDILTRAATAQKNMALAQETQGTINTPLGIGQGTKSAKDSASVFQAQFSAQDEQIAQQKAEQAGQAFTDELNSRLIAGTGKAAKDSASVFQTDFSQLDEIARLRAEQTGKNFTDDLNSRLITGITKSGKDSASAFQEQFDQLDQIAKLRAQQIAEDTQSGLNQSYGIGAQPKSAQASAGVFQQADQDAKAVEGLKNKYLPLYSIQQQYLGQLKEIRTAGSDVFATESQRGDAIQRTKDAFAAQVTAANAATEAGKGFGDSAGIGSTQAMALFAALRHMFDATAAGIPLTRVLAMEMGNLSYGLSGAGGIMNGISAVLSKIGSFLTPTTVGFGTLAAAVLIATTALFSFQSAQASISRQITGAGVASGATTGDINAIGAANSNSKTGLSVTSAQDLATALAATGKVGVDSIGKIVALGHDFATVYGINGVQAADLLAKSFTDPVKGADDLNQRLGFLDASTKLLIDSLVAQGNRQQAVNVLTAAIAPSISKASEVTTGWSQAWNAVANAASNAYHDIGQAMDRSMGGTGGRTIQQQIDDLQAAKKTMQENMASPSLMGMSTNPDGPITAPIGLPTAAGIDQINTKIAELTAKMQALNGAAGDARLKQRSLEMDGLARSMLPGIDAHLKATNAVKNLNEAMTNPALQKYITLIGTDLWLALKRVEGAEQASAGADPIKNQIAGMQEQVQALDKRTIAARAARASEAEKRNQSLDPNAGSAEERKQKQDLAAQIAAGGQTALDNVERQRISTLGQLASVDDVVHSKQLELNNLARDGVTFTDKQTASILAVARAQEEGTRLQERVSLGIASEIELRQQLSREQAAYISRSRTTPLSDQDIATYKVSSQKKYEQQSEQNAVAGSQLPQLKQMELDSASLRKELDTLSTTSLNNLTSNLADITTGTVSASQGFQNLGNQVIRSLEEMLIKMMIVAPIAKALQATLGAFMPGSAGASTPAAQLAEGTIPVATGGFITGPGTGTSDSIPARLSNGEFVVNAKATSQHIDLLHSINSKGFAAGGSVGNVVPFRNAGNDNGGGFRTPNIVINNHTDATPQVSKSSNGDVTITLKKAIDGAVGESLSAGTGQRVLRSQYGVNQFMGR